MKEGKGMCCIITPQGVIFSDKDRLNPENWPEQVNKPLKGCAKCNFRGYKIIDGQIISCTCRGP